MPIQVLMPQLGESVVEGTVGRWLVAEGKPVREYDPLLTVTTDKVDTEIPAPASGTLLKVLVAEGQTVPAGALLALIGQPGETEAPGEPSGGQESHQVSAPGGSDAHQGPHGVPAETAHEQPSATPLAQRVAGDQGVDLRQVPGTGPGGRITKEDVEAYLANPHGGQDDAQPPPSAAAPDAASGGHESRRAAGFLSPAVARLAAEYDVDLRQVIGTGEGGRITKKDVLAYIAAPVPPEMRAAAGTGGEQPASAVSEEVPAWEQPGSGSLFKPTEEIGAVEPATRAPAPRAPQPGPALTSGQAGDHAPGQPGASLAGEGDVVPLTAIRRSIAQHMIRSKQTSAHVTTVMEADMTRVVLARERMRADFERQGARLTFTPFFVQAIVAGLRAVPEANSTLRDEGLLLHRRIDIGIAVAIPDGLIVPVLRAADEKSLLGLARAVEDLAERARSKRLTPDEVQGATFTLTNHGVAGSLLGTPIINQPQAGILGAGAIQKRPVVISRGHALLPDADDYIAIRPMVYLSFSFDHRILDGARADAFLACVVKYLEDYTA